MKKYVRVLLTTLAIMLLDNSVFSQGSYLNLNAGYGLSMSPQNLHFFDFTNYTSLNNSITEEQIAVSLGKGVSFGGSFGYMFNKNIGAELGLSYLLGSEFEVTRTFSFRTTDYTMSANMFRINPSIVVACGFEKVNPYAKFGVLIGSGSIMYTLDEFDNGDRDVMKVKLDGGMALGFTSGIGALVSVSNKVSFFGEINMVNLSYAPTRGRMTEATVNGVDQLPGWSTDLKEIEFVDSYTYDFANPPADTEPNQVLRQHLPFGSIGFNLGLNIRFSGKQSPTQIP